MRESSFIYKVSDSSGTWIFNPLVRRIHYFKWDWEVIKTKIHESNKLGDSLLRLGLMTNADTYSQEITEYLEKKKSQTKKNLNIYYTITTRCDLKCDYCFQNHLNRSDTSKDTIDKMANLLTKRFTESKELKHLNLWMFGGEPLKRVDLCLYLSDTVRKICKTKGIHLQLFLTTNGLTAKSNELDSLKSAGIEGVQITFDGSRKGHNKARGKGYPSADIYGKTLRNIVKISERFSVVLKYNINKQNVMDFEEFINDIDNLGLLSKILINLEALQQPITNKNDSFFFNPNDPILATTYLKLAKLAENYGVKYSISSAFRPPCMVTSNNSLMIETDGSISSCLSAYRMPELALGNIATIDTINLKRDKYTNSILKACSMLCVKKECPYFPICESGCFFVKGVNGMSLSSPYCRETFYSQMVKGLIGLVQKGKICSLGI